MSEISTNEKLMELIFKGVDHSIESIKDSKIPLIPFVMTQKDEKIEIKRFVAVKLEEAVEKARGYIVDLTDIPDFAILAYEGNLVLNGNKYDAILIDAFDKSDSIAYCFAQRFKPKKFLSKFKQIGNITLVDKFESPFY
tara:strand:+ start:299 stop:715 length:417 start_codon:yes stop_codon:yes gene_type:complete